MIKLPIKDILKVGADIFDDVNLSKEELLKADLEYAKMDQELLQGQMEINKIEAQHKSIFVSGWRPFVGWICGIALAYHFIIYAMLKFFAVVFNWALPADLPVLSISELMPVLLGMLGLGTLRTYEKAKGVNSNSIAKMDKKEFRQWKKAWKMKRN